MARPSNGDYVRTLTHELLRVTDVVEYDDVFLATPDPKDTPAEKQRVVVCYDWEIVQNYGATMRDIRDAIKS